MFEFGSTNSVVARVLPVVPTTAAPGVVASEAAAAADDNADVGPELVDTTAGAVGGREDDEAYGADGRRGPDDDVAAPDHNVASVRGATVEAGGCVALLSLVVTRVVAAAVGAVVVVVGNPACLMYTANAFVPKSAALSANAQSAPTFGCAGGGDVVEGVVGVVVAAPSVT